MTNKNNALLLIVFYNRLTKNKTFILSNIRL